MTLPEKMIRIDQGLIGNFLPDYGFFHFLDFTENDAPSCATSPRWGTGHITIAPEKVIQHFRNAQGMVREGTGTVPSGSYHFFQFIFDKKNT